MPFPEITHLQFRVLSFLAPSERTGRSIREELERGGDRRSAPAFYQLMSRLEDQGLVTGWYEAKEVNGQRVRVRHYRIDPRGERVLAETRAFYGAKPERQALTEKVVAAHA